MAPEIIGSIGILVLLFLFMIGVPVAFAMALIGVGGFIILNDVESALGLLAYDIFDMFSSYTLSVIPMFIFMGSVAYAAGISQRLYKTTYVWLGSLRGGMTIATVFACAGFSAICGSTAATVATMGRIALPEMQKYNYSDRLSTGTIAGAGTLGILIPPSTILIIYGILTEQSIGELFLAGIFPGILLSMAFISTVIVLCAINPKAGPPGEKTTFYAKVRSLGGIFEALLLFALTIGGIFAGWFSPTQAGAIGASGAFVIGIVRRQMTLKEIYSSCREGLQTAVMILFIITGATIFGHFMAVSNIPFALADWVGSMNLPTSVLVGMIILVYFLGGFFMDSMALVVVTIPIFYPVVQRVGLDPIWFGVIIVLVAEMGVITPPVGVNVYIMKGIAPEDTTLESIFWGVTPFLIALCLVTLVIVLFPQIATFLPHLFSL